MLSRPSFYNVATFLCCLRETLQILQSFDAKDGRAFELQRLLVAADDSAAVVADMLAHAVPAWTALFMLFRRLLLLQCGTFRR